MGVCLDYVAVRGVSREEALRRLGLRSTGQREALPEHEVMGMDLPDGRYLILTQDPWTDEEIARLSSGGVDLVRCCVEEHTGFSMAEAYVDGLSLWSLVHESRKGRPPLETTGDLPEPFAALREEAERKQRESDDAVRRDRAQWRPGRDVAAGTDFLFSLPVDLVKALTGFTYDEVLDDAGASFEVLEKIASEPSAAAPAPARIRSHGARRDRKRAILLAILGGILAILAAWYVL